MKIDAARWHPERKIVGAAIAVVILSAIQVVADVAGVAVDVPPGVEGALTVLAAYWISNPRVDPDTD